MARSMDWELVGESEPNPSSGASLISIRGERPLGHSYSANVITKAVELVLSANSSFRGAARSLRILCAEAAESCPSLWSIRNWVLRLGLYELERPKLAAEDWVLILDHTIQIGPHKALLILGVQLADLNRNNFALGHQDVTMLGLEICEQSNGEKVLKALETVKAQWENRACWSPTLAAISRRRPDCFVMRHGHTDWIPDVGHRMARLLEAELKGDPKWERLFKPGGPVSQPMPANRL